MCLPNLHRAPLKHLIKIKMFLKKRQFVQHFKGFKHGQKKVDKVP